MCLGDAAYVQLVKSEHGVFSLCDARSRREILGEHYTLEKSVEGR